MFAAFDWPEERVDAKGSEGEREAFEVIVINHLIGKDHHVMFQPGGANVRDLYGAEGLRQIHAANTGAADLTSAFDFDGRHRFLLARRLAGKAAALYSLERSSPHEAHDSRPIDSLHIKKLD
jgi:hypothetical protein